MRGLACAIVVSLLAFVYGKPEFHTLIPNGQNVPNPCAEGGIWLAVGHRTPDKHTKEENPFGKAFKAANLTWTVELCRADSDGDGLSNGVELGDPSCTWAPGDPPKGTPKGHPGVCEDQGSKPCPADSFKCSDVKPEPDTPV